MNVATAQPIDSEKLLRAILDNAPENIVLIDKDCKLLCLNATMKKTLLQHFGKVPKVGDDYREYMKSPNKELFFEAFDKALGGEATEVELQTVGVLKWFRFSVNPIYDSDQQFLGVAFSAVDIHERKLAELALTERMKELGTIYKTNELLQNEFDSLDELLIKFVNLLPTGWQHPNICAAKIEFDNKTHQTKNYKSSPYNQTADISTQDGKTGFIEVVYTEATPPEDEGPFLKEERRLINAVAELFVVHYNKKLAYNALVRSQANLKSIYDNTAIGLLLLDKDFNILSFNNTIFDGFAYYSKTVLKVGGNFVDSLHEHKRETFLSIVQKAITNNSLVEYESEYTLANEKFYFSVGIVPVISEQQLIGFSISAIDVTKSKLLEFERQKMINDLIARNRDLEQFAYIVSHNLRAPIANIIGLGDLLKKNTNSEETRKLMLSNLDTSIARLDEVVRDLNDILQVKHELNESRVLINLNALVDSIKASLSQTIQSTNTVIETDFSEAPALLSIRTYLNSIFYNLISNSIKYGSPSRNPQLKIYSKRSDDRISIHFRDNGLGIDLDKYGEQLFGLYKRFHPEKEGKGIGLFMTKYQIEALGAKIDVASTPNEGTEFIITFTA